jgi:hypothetical protein
MISILHLLWIIPISMFIGGIVLICLCLLISHNRQEEEDENDN